MRRVLLAVLLLGSLIGVASPAAAEVDIQRAEGQDRIETAVALSQQSFDTASHAVVASSVAFPDALAATPLAAAVGGPLLLTPPELLPDVVGDELGRLGVETVHLMGGEQAVGAAVRLALEERGLTVERHAGENRFETAALAATAAVEQWQADGDAAAGGHVLVALGAAASDSQAWPDALASGVLAGVAHRPILLVTSSQVPGPTVDWLAEIDPDVVTVVGGTAAIPNEVMDDLGDADTERRRRGGADRYDTATLLADDAVTAGASADDVTIATGLRFPDALAAGAATVARGGVLLLAHGNDLDYSSFAREWLAEHQPAQMTIAGGTAAVSEGTVGQAQRAIDGFQAPSLRLNEVVSGLGTILGARTAPGDGRLHFWTREGRVFALGDGGSAQLVLDLRDRVVTTGEGGLLGLAFPRDHATSGRFLVHYTGGTGDLQTRLAEFHRGASPDATKGTEDRVYTLDQPATNHNGGTITVDPSGHLLLFLGDGGGSNDQFDNGQDPSTPYAAALRFDVSTPGAAVPAGAGLAHGAVWMYGLRNPFRADIDPVTELLHIADVGQRDWEEVNVVDWQAQGANFGWSRTEGAHCFQAASCDTSGITMPVIEYRNEGAHCSITGGHVYRGSIGMLRGHYFYGDFCSGMVRSFRYDDGVVEATDWTDTLGGGQIWSFGRDAAGEVYLSKGSTLYRIDAG